MIIWKTFKSDTTDDILNLYFCPRCGTIRPEGYSTRIMDTSAEEVPLYCENMDREKEMLKNLSEPTLPALTIRSTDIKLPFPPRKMYPVHIAGVNRDPRSEYFNTRWSIDLIAVPMESVRLLFKFKSPRTPESRRNLQVWVNNLGEALYNPLWWRIFPGGKDYPPRGGGRWPHRQHPYIDRVHGTHRIRALEALDANFVWVYFQVGAPSRVPRSELYQMKRNERPPTVSTTTGNCENCGARIQWEGGRDLTKSTKYVCKACGHHGERPPVYPEPV